MTSGALVAHLLLGLVVVFGIMAGLARLVRRSRSGLRGGRRAPAIEAVARLSLSKATSVAVLRVGQRELLVGVSAGTVSLLAETGVGVLTGAAPMTIDMCDTPDSPALASPALTQAAGLTLGSASTALSVRPVTALGSSTTTGQAWWPTFVEVLRQRTARTTTARMTGAHRP
jgi:flagellar protein FliO/FliZ